MKKRSRYFLSIENDQNSPLQLFLVFGGNQNSISNFPLPKIRNVAAFFPPGRHSF
ncbi:hypothetical protein C943_01295 [Mariniradius saccharolyticus AK6]|uniref:Uncharacterized protein n=1 Tax=Mariniradius saccharolyticus AK6 TaxID=1239962 RepID=M7XDA4_9BACT|nr:hypothetical protein C943_01295 [Mariniradius saccharolyticus AK6]